MKRKREETKYDPNHFFKTIVYHPELLNHIFDHLILPKDILNIYRLLYDYHFNNKEILIVMECYLIKRFTDANETLTTWLDFFFYNKMDELKDKYITIDKRNINEYTKKLLRFEDYKHVKHFIKYGICVLCEKFPIEVDYVEDFENYLENELETRYAIKCSECTEADVQMCHKSTEIKEYIDYNEIVEFFADNHGIRYFYPDDDNKKNLFLLTKDVQNYKLRQKKKEIESKKIWNQYKNDKRKININVLV